jgi:hypothetical protein
MGRQYFIEQAPAIDQLLTTDYFLDTHAGMKMSIIKYYKPLHTELLYSDPAPHVARQKCWLACHSAASILAGPVAAVALMWRCNRHVNGPRPLIAFRTVSIRRRVRRSLHSHLKPLVITPEGFFRSHLWTINVNFNIPIFDVI